MDEAPTRRFLVIACVIVRFNIQLAMIMTNADRNRIQTIIILTFKNSHFLYPFNKLNCHLSIAPLLERFHPKLSPVITLTMKFIQVAKISSVDVCSDFHFSLPLFFGAGGGTRTPKHVAIDFKSIEFTNFSTPAY